jgi:hypothetical protein
MLFCHRLPENFSGHSGKRSARGDRSRMLRELIKYMEVLLFALIAVRNGYRQEENYVPEPDHFQPFDLRALEQVRHTRNDSSNRPSDRSPSLEAQVAS